MRKNYSKEQRTKIIELYSSGTTVTELSNKFGIARSTIYSWLKDSKNNKLVLILSKSKQHGFLNIIHQN